MCFQTDSVEEECGERGVRRGLPLCDQAAYCLTERPPLWRADEET